MWELCLGGKCALMVKGCLYRVLVPPGQGLRIDVQ